MGFSFNTLHSDYSNEFITVRTAAEISGYNNQYLRRLLRENILKSKRLGQIWLIERKGFVEYIKHEKRSNDKRYGPQYLD